jgi:inosine/xanthosine triphosphatase
MSKILVAVGSKRGPKLNAVREALALFGEKLASSAEFEVVGEEVPSGVGHTPLSGAEIMAGARGRAEALIAKARDRSEPWKFFVGLEGGLDILADGADRRVFLKNWAYVADRSGRGVFGQSGAIEMPRVLAARVLDEGVELAEAIDAFAGGHGIRDAQGAWGVLTGNLITRQEAFRVAVINAFAPFFNRDLYGE